MPLFKAAVTTLFATVLFAQTPSTQRTIPLPGVESQQGLNEIASIVRTILDIREIKGDFASRSLDVTGTANQIAAAEWIVNALENPTRQRTSVTQYHDPASDRSTVRVFFLRNTTTLQGVQEVGNAVRTMTGVQRLLMAMAVVPAAVVVRGTSDQDAACEWLLNALDTPENKSSPGEYWLSGNDPELIRILALPASWTPEKIRETMIQIRNSTKIVRLFPLMQARAIAVRGTAAQVEQAEQLVK